ncbi:class I SAM-dependent methyltransferase [Actinophytocola sp.]|uniref:class I SAM-dependent methyltransferase n=1 Tax=Actinophytocola sp. TaxID=1872138 RepID=UPI002D81169E|nr:class I SAM-dependent methyltransferase [Actinophytocola sp.]HET9144264.1 class I SAM-dependent methyltransferase [Actinophytocola sp.]HEU5109035.1 class I SAM-dependent methyltransferase [Micromonosporaceae bacterium]
MEETYGRALAEVYDQVYAAGRGKDYAAESAALAELVDARHPRATSLLDVACGTGEHLRHLRGRFAEVEGLELSEPMRAKAVAKLPGVVVHAGDMRCFALRRRFDVVACLFSSIGYTRSVAELHAAVRAMAGHVEPGGLLVIDPWFHPDGWQGGALDHTVAVAAGRTVLRLARSARDGRTSRVEYHYLVGDATGITSFTDLHEMTLFTAEEYTTAISAAGCARIEFVPGWASGRGRIVAVRR